MKMEAAPCLKQSEQTYNTTRRRDPKEYYMRNTGRVSLKTYVLFFFLLPNLVLRLPALQLNALSIDREISPFIFYLILQFGLGALYGPLILHMLPVSVHLTILHVFNGTVNLKPYHP
jgi:hypothetical protein